NDSLLDFDGLVMDETQSKLGKDFYDIFYKEWDSPKHVLNYTIVIREKPVPSLGTQVMVVIDDKTVFQNFLQPRIEIIEEAAKAAVAYSRQYLQIYHKSIFK
ncbi:MAG TPA: CsgE family curli-type amyloid fiber assembly protein, partial [Balneolales bacterium]|nr:CsgE family curli-type amyloid fiber assembly protein [Balneolales bacterium]